MNLGLNASSGSGSSSSHLFSLVRCPLAASGIEESIAARFLDVSEDQLVTIGANVLKVFRIRPQNLTDTGQYDDLNPPKMRLECMATWTLSSPIQSIGKVRFLNARRDSLVLSFLDAKISVIDYDPETHDLKTVSLHIFEDQEVRSGYVSNQSIPFIRVDPDSRCAAMLIYGRKIVILPFKRDLLVSTEDELLTGEPHAGKSAAPVLSSYALDLSTVLPAHTVENVIDIQFLHGYNQPTLMILYEPLKTCPGRIAVRKDTCRLDVVTLDVKERVCAFIWSKENLPFDCLKAIPVPKPIGGTLVFSVNAVHYLNQGIPAFGLSLNSIGDATLENIARQELVSLTLDCAQAVFITPERAVISLRGGEIYVMSLILDGGIRSVRGFHFDRAAASVLTTCLTVLEDRFLFLGSRLGNSLLLQFREKELNSIPEAVIETIEPPLKKKRTDGNEDWMASDVGDIKDVDLEVYGREDKVATSRVSSYSFEVCDSLLNIGPCGNVSMGDPAFLSEEFNSAKMADPDVELVTTSGHGKNGALCVLQKTIRPQVVTTFELPGCLNMWTVHGDTDLANGHAFLILSRADSTMVLQTGQEINELDSSGFFTQGPTIFTGNMGNNKYIIQVSQNGAWLLKGSKRVQHLPLELSGPIVRASCADPYLVIMTSEGQLVLLTLETKVGSPKLSILKANLKSRSKLLNICAYKDVSGLFTTEAPETVDESGASVKAPSSTSVSTAPPIPDIEDEDALLYGDAAPTNLFAGDSRTASSSNQDPLSGGGSAPFWRKHMKPHKASFWVFLYREDGHLEILTLPDFSVKYVVHQFYLGHDVLVDGTTASEESIGSSSLKVEASPAITEILMVGLGAQGSRPVLLARSQDHELLCYEAFAYYEKTDKDQIKIRFKKTKHGLILRERRGKTRKEAMAAPKSSMRVFHDIAGYEGVFLCGPYPHWLMLTSRGELRTHPMPIDGPVPCFAAFHNVNCPQGFLYFNKKGELRICVLPTHLSYDAPWPVRKVPLRLTPHFITYHLESKTYAVVTSSSEPTKQVWKFNGDDKELVDETRDDRYPWPSKDMFTLQLFSPVSWEPIPNTKELMNEWERCTSLKHLCLSSEGLHSGQRGYIVCGTSYSYGEDVTPRGYIRIYDVIEVIPEPGQPLTKNKIKTVYDKEQKGPVTSITAVNGYLVATVGQKIYIFQFKNKDLFGVAFIDSQIYIHQLVSLKNFILVGDVMKSVDLLQFQQDYRTLAVISRDSHPLEVYSCEYIVDNNVLAFMVTDADKNMAIFMYQPDNRESRGGQQLVRKADFHLGQHVNTIFRIRAKITDPTTSGRVITGWEKRQVTWFATLDGALGYLLPCAEKTFRRLQMLLNVLNHAIPHPAGLNPKASRIIRQQRKDLLNPAKSVVDGDLVFKFTDMSHPMKHDFAKKIGTSALDLMDDLAELDRMAAHF